MEWCSSVRGVSHGPPPSRVPLPSRVRAGLISDASASPQNAACALVRARLLSDRPAPAERAACGPVCRVYAGELNHKGASYPGEHAAIITRALFDAVQEKLTANRNGAKQLVQCALLDRHSPP